MTKVEFDKWVNEMIEKYGNDQNVVVRRFGYATYIGYNFKTNKIEIARCHPDDEFNDKIGIAIAYARCKGIEVPKISTYKKLSEMKNGDRFYLDGDIHFFVGKAIKPIGKHDYYAIIDIKEDTIYRYGNIDKEYEMVE